MTITLKLFASLQKYMPEDATGRQATLEVAESSSTGAVLDSLGVPQANAHLILLNGTQSDWEASLSEGDTLSVFPPVAGGSQ